MTTHSEERHIKNHKMQRHAQHNSHHKIHILPHWQPQQTFILRQRIHSIEHLNRHQDRQTDRRGALCHPIREHLTPNFREFG